MQPDGLTHRLGVAFHAIDCTAQQAVSVIRNATVAGNRFADITPLEFHVQPVHDGLIVFAAFQVDGVADYDRAADEVAVAVEQLEPLTAVPVAVVEEQLGFALPASLLEREAVPA